MELDWFWLFSNRIIQWKGSYKCVLCTFEFGVYYVQDIKDHIGQCQFHVRRIQQINCELIDSKGQAVTSSLSEQLVKNGVFFNIDDNQLTCYPCQCKLPCYLDVSAHVESGKHQEHIRYSRYRSNPQTYVFTNNLHCKICSFYCETPVEALWHIMEHFPKMLQYPTTIDIIEVSQSQITCGLCDIKMDYNDLKEHLTSTNHIKRRNFLKGNNETPKEDPISIEEKRPIRHIFLNSFDSDTWHCNKCETKIQSKTCLIEHFLEEKHKLNAINKRRDSDHLIKKSVLGYKCYMCNESFGSQSYKLFFHYNFSVQHKIRMEIFDKIFKQKYLKMEELNNKIFIECSVCQIMHFNSVESVIDHISEQKHKSNENLHTPPVPTRKESEDRCTQIAKNNKTEKVNSHSTDGEQLQQDVLDIINNLDELRESKSNSSNAQIDQVFSDPNTLHQYIDFCVNRSGKNYIYNLSDSKRAHMDSNIYFIVKNQLCLICERHFSNEPYVIMEHIFSKKHNENLVHRSNQRMKTKDSSDTTFIDSTFSVSYILRTSTGSFHCHACKINIEERNYLEHYVTKDHQLRCESSKRESESDTLEKINSLLQDSWYHAEFFDCQVCDKKYQVEIEFVEHLIRCDHLMNMQNCAAKSYTPEFHTCFACETLLYGDVSQYYDHCEDDYHKRNEEKGNYEIPEMLPTLLKLLKGVEDKKRKILDESKEIILENELEKRVIKDVVNVVESVYPNATAYKFGSRSSNTALFESDLDIFLDFDDMNYNKSLDAASIRKYLASFEKCFEKYRDVWYVEEVLYDTRIPIIKLRHNPTNLNCNISCSNGLAHRKSELIRYFNDAYPICRELILYLKKWLIFSQLSGTKGISSFTASWLVIFYLQVKGVFPSVYELIKCQSHSVIVDGWECGYQENFCAKPDNLSFVEHLVGLFTFYAIFDYQKYVMCPYLGKIIHKQKFALKELPVELTAILSDKNKDAVFLYRFDSPMCMQDPIDLSQNSSKALSKRQLRCFREYCSLSVDRIIYNHNMDFYTA
ncbi:uncharacterized protein LOC106653427 [Trichogramma pretiosum]|uniref:uncharacterized protein LOC106653427 n=1 Tax=Trichogramma pretiosum TaxID=7493 RepID=UPI000C71C31E|nr:uncharacterized protein LOC106653427 [Trichogramma pretiosum]